MENAIDKPPALLAYRVYTLTVLAFLPLSYVYFCWIFGRLDWPTTYFGYKTDTLFDMWSFQHILNGVLFARLHQYIREDLIELRWNKYDCIWTTLFLCYAWEGHEAWAEIGMRGQMIASWLGGIEHWTNRVIADPLLSVCGVLVYFAFPKSVKPAFALSLVWITLNLMFANCMTLQNLILTLSL